MKSIYSFTLRMLLPVFTFFIVVTAHATIYTVVQSGLYSTPSTWSGGIRPPYTLPTGDGIVVPQGMTLTLDSNLDIIQSATGLTVNGKLTDTFYIDTNFTKVTPVLTVKNALFDGSGEVDITSFVAQTGMIMNFSGTFKVLWMESYGMQHSGGAHLVIKKAGWLRLKENDYLFTNGTITPDTNAGIYLEKGSFKTPAGSTAVYDFFKPHRIFYTTVPHTTGTELVAGAPQEIRISTKLTMTRDITANSLIIGGDLELNGYKFTFGPNSSILQSLTIVPTASSVLEVLNNGTNDSTLFLKSDGTIDNNIHIGDVILNTKNRYGILCLRGDLYIHNSLQLKKGRLAPRYSDIVIVSDTTQVTGASDSSFVCTNIYLNNFNDTLTNQHKAGRLIMPVKPQDTTVFPIGHIDYYTPLHVAYANNSLAPTQMIGAGVGTAVREYAITGGLVWKHDHAVMAQWQLSYEHTATSPDSLYVEAYWRTIALEKNSFDRTKAYLSQITYNSQSPAQPVWDRYPVSATNVVPYMRQARTLPIAKLSGQQYTYLAVFDEKTFNSVQHTEGSTPIRIYPNPANDVLHIDMPMGADAKATVYNATGQAVLNTQVGYNRNTINISTLPQGMYYLQLKGGKVNSTVRFVKK